MVWQCANTKVSSTGRPLQAAERDPLPVLDRRERSPGRARGLARVRRREMPSSSGAPGRPRRGGQPARGPRVRSRRPSVVSAGRDHRERRTRRPAIGPARPRRLRAPSPRSTKIPTRKLAGAEDEQHPAVWGRAVRSRPSRSRRRGPRSATPEEPPTSARRRTPTRAGVGGQPQDEDERRQPRGTHPPIRPSTRRTGSSSSRSSTG